MAADLSYDKGSNEPPLLEHMIGEAILIAARRWPDNEALVSCHQQIRLTWAELLRNAKELASCLLDCGIKPGDRVGIWGPNCAEWTITQFRTALAGIVLVKINPASGGIVPRGVPGEVCTRGYSVMLGYWGEPDKTSEAIRDGWMHTGDLAVMDGEGF